MKGLELLQQMPQSLKDDVDSFVYAPDPYVTRARAGP